ncbi:MAG TPA: Uma2 family endonuclease [Candidatus Tyrphobacter sp.]
MRTIEMRDDEKPYVEIVDGQAIPKVSPKHAHGYVQITLGAILRRCSQSRGTTASEWRFHVDPGHQDYVPDVAFVSFERLRPLSKEERENPSFAPDVAVEIRSPSDKPAILQRKIDVYLLRGSLVVLEVDPTPRTVVVHERGGAIRRYAAGERLTSETLPWLEFDVAEAFEGLDALE